MKGKASARRPLATPRHIKDLVPDPENRRKHNPRNIGMVVDSLQQVGAGRSIVIDENHVILAGNGVIEAAGEAGITKLRIVDAKGDEIIAVRRSGLSAEQKRALAIADNRMDVRRSFGTASGSVSPVFTVGSNADTSLAENHGSSVRPAAWSARSCSGFHSASSAALLCGDCTDHATVARLCGDTRAGLMNTDPPYGIDFDNAALGPTRKHYDSIVNDKQASGDTLQLFLEAAFRVAKDTALRSNAAWYLWHAHLTQGYFAAAAAAAANLVLHRQIIWVKPRLILGRGQYHWKHELCFMGWVDGNQCPDYGLGNGERTQTTVWEVAGVTKSDRDAFDHASPKPVELFKIPIVKHLRSGEVCYEPFAGSGPQFIAGEQHGVRCFGLELAPKFCQVIIDRWEAFAGEKAKKVGEAVVA